MIVSPPMSLLKKQMNRFHRELKASLIASSTREHWVYHLALALLCMRSTLKQGLGGSPSELVYGTTFRLPGDIFPLNSTLDPDTRAYLKGLRHILLLPQTSTYTHVPMTNSFRWFQEISKALCCISIIAKTVRLQIAWRRHFLEPQFLLPRDQLPSRLDAIACRATHSFLGGRTFFTPDLHLARRAL